MAKREERSTGKLDKPNVERLEFRVVKISPDVEMTVWET